jgi:ABC-type oligopeptide transport system ATPase subunit
MSLTPREFPGGQRQCIGIDRILVLEPTLLICDDPASVLDLSIYFKILNLFL